MARSEIVIWGASGHALVVADILRLNKTHEIAGFLYEGEEKGRGEMWAGAPVLGGREQLKTIFSQGIRHLIVAIGNCRERVNLAKIAEGEGFELVSAIHPKAVIAEDARVGKGSVVAAGAVINPESVIGENVIVNTSATIDHECRIGEGAHIGPGAHLGGGVSIGKSSWLGIGAIIKDHIKIGDHVTIGAGSVVLVDLPDGILAYGVPARIQQRQADSGDSPQ